MTYDEALKMWAAQKLSVSPDEVTYAEADYYVGGGCDTCGYDSVTFDVFVRYGRKSTTLSTTFHDLLRELFEASGG